MSNGTEHKESLDRFSGYVKERLENHRTSVDSDSWEVIAGHLKRRKLIRLGWIASCLAAAMLIGLLWILVPSDIPVLQNEIALKEEQLFPAEKKAEPVIVESVREEVKIAKVSEKKADIMDEDILIQKESVQEQAKEMLIEEKNDVREEKEEVPELTERNTTTDKEPVNNYTSKRKIEFVEHSPKRNTGKWLLAAAFGTGGGDASINWGGVPGDELHNDYNSSESGGVIPMPPEMNEGSPQNADEYADVSHAIPISVGVSLRKDLSRYFAIETGLFYTYLSSDLKKKNISRMNDQLELHYLGVPVNLIGYLINRPQWNLYLSGGVMLEKGLRSVYTERVYHPDKIVTTTGKTSISGVQVSLNGAIGIAYRVFDHWSIYAEPKLYYYFDTDQPISVRTERPFGFGINAGVRYQF